MNIYFIKVALRGISPMVWRRLRIPGNTSLAMLHDLIQCVYSWDSLHLHQFHIHGKDYGINYIGAVCYPDNARKVYIDDFSFDVGDKFTYTYNFFKNHVHDIRIEKIESLTEITNQVPMCLSGSGMLGVTKYDIVDVKHRMLKTIVAKKGTLTAEDIIKFAKKLARVEFNKKRINTKIMSYKAN